MTRLNIPAPHRGPVWLVALGLLGLSIAPAAIVRAEDSGSDWTRTLAGGEVVELIGVSTHPSGPATWWRPDGSRLAEAPYNTMHSSASGGPEYQTRELAARLAAPAGADEPSVVWKTIPGNGYVGGGAPEKDGRQATGLRAVTVTLPAAARACTVRVGVASGPWTTEATHDGRGHASMGNPKGAILFGKARATGPKTTIALAENLDGLDLRLVAIDPAGKVHGPSSSSAVGSGGFRLRDVEFDLEPGAIRDYQLQSRAYHWAEFDEVRLRPRAGGEPR